MIALFRSALSVLFLVAAFGAPAAAQTTLELIRAGDFDAARAQMDKDNASGVDRAFAEALIANRAGRKTEAIDRLRALLRVRPDLVAPRRALAEILVATRQYEAAEFQFERLRELDPNNRAAYNRILRNLFAQKPFGFTASGAIAPSTNVNRGSSTNTFSTGFGDFVIDEDNLGQTGVGLSLNLGAFRRIQLDGGQRLQFDARTSVIFYDKPQFNQHSFTLRATVSDSRDGTSWSVAPEVSRTYLAGARNFDRAALMLARGWTLTPKTGLTVQGLAEYRDYTTSDTLDGPRYELETRLTRRLDARTQVTGALAYKRGDTASDAFKYNGVEIGARLSRAFQNGIQLGLGAAYEWRPYVGDFTGVSFPRRDAITSVDFSVFNDKWTIGGAAPTYSCKLTWSASNVAFYDYTVQECTVGFTRNF